MSLDNDRHVQPGQRFLALVREAFADNSLIRVTLGAPLGTDRTLKAVLVRPVLLRQEPRLSFVYRHANRDITKNCVLADGLARIEGLLGKDFRTAQLSTTQHIARLEYHRERGPRLTLGPPLQNAVPSLAHDRLRRHPLAAAQAPWLVDLGVTGVDGKVAKGMEAKYRQIQKFVELLQHLLAEAGLKPAPSVQQTGRKTSGGAETAGADRAVHLADMGSGKGYLTFAAHEALRSLVGARAHVVGFEVRPELVSLCDGVARKHGLAGLRFVAGAIADAPLEAVDVLVALHACDTATDDAIARGIQAGARLIVVSPCCHKELRTQLRPPLFLGNVLKHGILLEREAEFVTDALRAALLEWAGYDTRVFEFIAAEHTGKNLMIAAIRRQGPAPRAAAERQVRDLAGFYGVRSQRLAAHLGLALATPAARPAGHD